MPQGFDGVTGYRQQLKTWACFMGENICKTEKKFKVSADWRYTGRNFATPAERDADIKLGVTNATLLARPTPI